ncbi:MAG: SCO1664 family protein [Nitriliruptoraceae bacterium]
MTASMTPADRLRSAPVEVVGRFADASNATLLVRLTDRDQRSLEQLEGALGRAPELDDLDPDDLAVYKPQRGERPLWDFPAGTLHRREVAAHEVSLALGWEQVPTTVLRVEAPFGAGSLQGYVAHDVEEHYFTLLEGGDPAVVAQLEAMVVFDALIENADRKAGHVLFVPGTPGRVWLIDHGVSFHTGPKLRTVAWELAGQDVPPRLLADVDRLRERLAGDLGARLRTLLTGDEVAALEGRCVDLLARGTYPQPTVPHPYPWPLL